MVIKMMKTNLKIMLHALFFMLLAFMTSSPVLSDEHITYVHFDALGSSIAGSDSTGSLVWSEEYQPYGDRIVSDNSTGNNLWYTGKASYENFGLSYFGARWYNPVLGRFTGIDPVKYQEDNIHSFNRYAYANNNPYKFVDPDGLSPKIPGTQKGLAGNPIVAGVKWAAKKGLSKDIYKKLFDRKNNKESAGAGAAKGLGGAAQRLGLKLDDIPITNGVARAKINISDTLNPQDIGKLKDALRSRGATRAEIDTGLIANPKLDSFLRRRVQDGKPFNGGTVRPSTSKGSDFTIDFGL